VSHEPPPLNDAIELHADRTGYAYRMGETTSTVLSIVGMTSLMGLSWLIGTNVWPDAHIGVIVVAGTFGVPLTAHFVSEWWLKQQPTPTVSLISAFRPGSPVTVDVMADPSTIHRVEVLATIKKTSKNHEGETRTTNVRVATGELAPAAVDHDPDADPIARYRGVVPQGALTMPTWFVAVYLIGDQGIRYVRPYPVVVAPDTD